MKTSFILKILAMMISLGAVIYGIKALRSPEMMQSASDPQGSLSLLLGSDFRAMNWCPQDVTKVEIYDFKGAKFKELTSAQDLASVCEIMQGAFSNEGLESATYSRRMVAYGGGTSLPTELEQISGQEIFRLKGLPFRSPMLVKVLDRFEKP